MNWVNSEHKIMANIVQSIMKQLLLLLKNLTSQNLVGGEHFGQHTGNSQQTPVCTQQYLPGIV